MSKRILIIDDEEDVRAVAQLGLEMAAGWQVLTATSASEGMRMAAQQQPDAILLDLSMPEVDGWAALRHLRTDPRTQNIPVILLTARALEAADPAQYQAVLSKPFRPLQLADQIAAALGWA